MTQVLVPFASILFRLVNRGGWSSLAAAFLLSVPLAAEAGCRSGACANPTQTITQPSAGASFRSTQTITIAGRATGGGVFWDGDLYTWTIARVEIHKNGTYQGNATLGASGETANGLPWRDYTYTVPAQAAGSYTLGARAFDSANAGASSTSTVSVTVAANSSPTVSIASPSSGSVVTQPNAVSFTTSASDSDGTVASVQYFLSGGSAISGALATAPYSFSWSPSPGTYYIRAQATDNEGAFVQSNPIEVVVNDRPAISLSTSNINGTAPGSITLQASASDSRGGIASVQYFRNGSALSGALTSSPYTFIWSSVGAGSHSLVARATDAYGATSDSSPYTFVVNAAPSIAISGPAHNSVATAPASFALTASASDTDGSIASVQYFANGAAISGAVSSAPYTFGWSGVAAGTYSITAVATDNRGAATTSSSITLVANDRPVPTLQVASPDTTTPGGASLQSTVANSIGSVASVVYFANGSAISPALTAPPYAYSWSGAGAGTYSIVARATDSHGATADSTSYSLVVTEPSASSIVIPNASNPDAGTLPGALSVLPSGAAAYSIDIAVPPGTAGMQPRLALAYNSKSGDGMLGRGWTLTGLTSISRCPRTLAQDGVVGRVSLTADDRYCFGGQRLVLVPGSGTYGMTAEYRTEIDSFVKVNSYGVDAAKGPDRWEVRTKDGQLLHFGNSQDSAIEAQGRSPTVIQTWLLTSVHDLSGNYMTVSYDKSGASANGEVYPIQMSYTGNSVAPALAPYHAVRFVYEARPDAVVRYQGGSKTSILKRLIAIKTFVSIDAQGLSGQLVRDYRIQYQQSSHNNRSLVQSVALYDGGSPARSLPATQFTYQQRAANDNAFASAVWGGPGIDFQAGTASLPSILAAVVNGDFDGDGRQDLAYGVGNGQWQVCLSSGAAFTCQAWAGPVARAKAVIPGDFNGDGRLDLAHPGGSGLGTEVQVCLSTGSGFSCSFWAGEKGPKIIAGDFTGDGRTDLGVTNGGGLSRLCTSTGVAFSCADYANVGVAASMTVEDEFITTRVIQGDFNGDGRADVATYFTDPTDNGPSQWNICIAGDSGFTCGWQGPAGTANNVSLPGLSGGSQVDDLNEDGLPDLITVFNAGTSAAIGKLCLSTSSGYSCSDMPSGMSVHDYTVSHVADFDGDGRPDTIHYTTDLGSIRVCQWSLEAYSCSTWGGATPAIGPGSGNHGPFYGDFDGDGKTDLAFYRPETQQWTVSLSQGSAPDLMTAVVNGIGHRAEVTHSPSATSGLYARDGGGSAAAYPDQDVGRVGSLVSQLRSGNGIGGLAAMDLRYGGKKRHLRGRGDLGFRWTESTDAITQLTTRVETRQAFPFTGIPASSSIRHGPTACLLEEAATSVDEQVSQGGAVHFPHVSAQLQTKRELNGCLLVSQTSTSGIVFDAYGNVTASTQSVTAGGEVFTTAVLNSYAPVDTAAWLVDRLHQASISKTAPVPPGGTANSLTRTTQFTYVPGTRLVATQTVEPTDPLLRLATDTSARDRFGNVTAKVLRWTPPGAGVEQSRTVESVVQMDARGRWPLKLRNALNQEVSKTLDDAYGNALTATDANGLVTTFAYDTFGAMASQTDPDTTRTVRLTKQCTSGCGHAKLVRIEREEAQDGSLLGSPKVTYLDALGRETLVQSWGFDGTETRVVQEFDANRRLYRASRPHYASDMPAWTTYGAYDDLGRNTQFTTSDGTTRITHAELSTTVSNPLNQRTTRVVNGLGLLKTSTDNAGSVTTDWYDAFGNLVKSVDPLGNVIDVGYDRLGRRTSLKDPNMGTTTYVVDALGQVLSQRDAKGQQTTFTFDDLGRLRRRLEPDLDSRWDYDSAAHGIGKLAEAYTVNGLGAKDYRRVHQYDSLSRPIQVTTTLDQDHVSQTAYDPVSGRVASETHDVRPVGATTGSGHSFVYRHNGFGFLQRIDRAGTAAWEVLQQDAEGRVVRGRHGNGVVVEKAFDPGSGRVDSIAAMPPGSSLASVQHETYGYDAVGNLRSRTQLTGAGGSLVEQFTFDGLNRVRTAQVTRGSTVLPLEEFTYDAVGNLLSKTGVGTYVYPASGGQSVRPHAVASIVGSVNGVSNPVFDYDDNGNLRSGGGRTYLWTSYNLPSSITLGAGAAERKDLFLHGPEHQRTQQRRFQGGSSSASATVYYGGAIEREVAANGDVTTKTYVPGGVGVVTDKVVGGQASTATLAFHRDHLGSIAAISDQTGTVVERLSFDVWGLRRNTDGSMDTGAVPGHIAGQRDNKGYTGHEHLDDVRLVHMNGRVFDPVVGRFTSADPMVDQFDSSQGSNRYAYVLNNPLSYTDPTGYQTKSTQEDSANVQSAGFPGGNCAGTAAAAACAGAKGEFAKAAKEIRIEFDKLRTQPGSTAQLKALLWQYIQISGGASETSHAIIESRWSAIMERQRLDGEKMDGEFAGAVAQSLLSAGGGVAGGAPLVSKPSASTVMPVINKQKQAGHVPGTPQYINRIGQQKPTSSFHGQQSGEAATRIAYKRGQPVPGRPNVREYDFGLAVGTGPNGGSQTRVRVHESPRTGEIHGHPSGPERF